MAGQFHGLNDMQWGMIAPLLPKARCGVGRPNPDLRQVLNTILYVTITGCRWCDVPEGMLWAKRSTAHEWLGRFQENGTWDKLRNGIIGLADLADLIDWQKGSADGSFSPGKRRR